MEYYVDSSVSSVNDKKIPGISECGCYIGEPQSRQAT